MDRGRQIAPVSALTADGKCGAKSKAAIGAFQLRYVPGISTPDCRVDPGGKTTTYLGMDYSAGVKVEGDPVNYDKWPKTPTNVDEEPPFWDKRGMFWFGAGAKIGGGAGVGGDLGGAILFNLKNHDNYFGLGVSTRRYLNVGGGVSGGAQLCFATGIYDPSSLNKIKSSGGDWAFAVGAKWLSFAGWAASLPKLGKLVSAMSLGKYANGDTASELGTLIKAGLSGFDLREDDTNPTFVAIDIPFLGAGTEVSISYGVTSYRVLYKNLV
jgi:hypothetical protein